jgi:diguanylate cyclase (GGDEF)-like protein/PAS domain S-box-containing protein
MRAPISVLFVENSENDAALAVRVLQRGGLDVRFERVDTARAVKGALSRQSWDAVIADHRMPQFTGLDALRIVRASGSDVPFILISGTVGEEMAVQAMKAGADDFVLKSNLARLPQVLERELREAADRALHRETQSRLRESEAGLNRAQAMAKLAHVITGPEGEFLRWSDTLPPLTGMDPATMPASTREWLAYVHPEDRAGLRATAIDAARTHARRELEYRLRRGGDWIHIRQVLEPLAEQPADDGGLRWFNTLQDVSEQKHAERDLQRFRQAMDLSPDAIYLTDPASMRFVYVNDTACQRLGYSRERLLQMDTQDVLPVARDPLRRGNDDVVAAGERSVVHESPFVLGDGTRGWAEIHSRTLRTAEGTLIVTISRNITERKRADEQIRRLNRVYAVLSGINALIVRVADTEELFRQACRIAVEAGRFRCAWIGVLDREAGKVAPVAWHGVDDAYMRELPLALDPSRGDGYSVAGRAVSEGKPVIVEDMAHDARIVLGAQAVARGLRSLAMLPVVVSGRVAGVLALYAAEVSFFDEDEVRLLTELAGDIAFALDHIEKAKRVDYLSYYDPLTGLPNRALFHERLTVQLQDVARENGKVALLMLDIERFKTLNDTLGRQAGDALLREVAKRIEEGMHPASWAARIGGDHFAIVVPGLATEEQIGRRIDTRFSQVFGPPFPVAGAELRVSACIGVAVFPGDGADADALFRNAEAALKKAKATGERYLFFTQEMTARVAGKLSLENKLRQALERDEFVLHYQPKVDLENRRIAGLEALIRWQSPELGLVPPGEFIPLLEETGLILQVGSWALTRAARDHRGWVERKLKAPRVAVNVSQIQLRQRDFVAIVEQAIIEGVAPVGIDLEITESLVMQDVQANIEKLKAVRALGIRIAIDDFGTGYSSLAYLSRLPVEMLKIDRAFINAMLDDPASATLVQTMISLAHSLSLKVVAEGVETEEQAEMLRRLLCDEMQGYLFSRPLPGEQVDALLESKA